MDEKRKKNKKESDRRSKSVPERGNRAGTKRDSTASSAFSFFSLAEQRKKRRRRAALKRASGRRRHGQEELFSRYEKQLETPVEKQTDFQPDSRTCSHFESQSVGQENTGAAEQAEPFGDGICEPEDPAGSVPTEELEEEAYTSDTEGAENAEGAALPPVADFDNQSEENEKSVCALSEKKNLPDGRGEEEQELTSGEELTGNAFLWNEEAKPKSKKQKKHKKGRGLRAAQATVMLSSLIAAFVILICVVCSLPSPDEDIPAGAIFTGEENGSTESEKKVIYVRQYGDDPERMSTPELYTRCIDSVVSISARSENGSKCSIGSGFVISEDGYIATVNHVLEGMKEVKVILSDGTEYAADVIAGEERTDLALLKIQAKGLTAAQFGDSSALLTGERVIAIGTPASLDYAGSICSGEVSYSLRTVKIFDSESGALEKKMKLIQTNAPVNPGNSGCPLFDEAGKVVGIITMKLGNQFTGIGFAVPSNGARNILEAMRHGEALSDELLCTVTLLPPKLGISGAADEKDGLRGVRVTAFESEECDAARKLKTGDLIIGIGNTGIATVADLANAINEHDAGETVTVIVYRSGQKLTFEVMLFQA